MRDKLKSRLSIVYDLIFVVGGAWAILMWLSWPYTPHRGYMTALMSALYLAPAYLLVSVRRGRGYGMRAFVTVAVVLLIITGTRIVPGRIDLIWAYLCLPPLSGACAIYMSNHFGRGQCKKSG